MATAQGAAMATPAAVIVPAETPYPESLAGMKYDDTCVLGLGIYSNVKDEVGIISTSTNFDATPKTITFTVDRMDEFVLRFLQRYCVGARPGFDKPTDESQTAKEYECGVAVRQDATADTTVGILDSVFFVWIGPPTTAMNDIPDESTGKVGKSKRTIVYGLASITANTLNLTTAFQTDNQISFTLTMQPRNVPAEITSEDLYLSASVNPAEIGTGIGSSLQPGTLAEAETLDVILPDYEFFLPAFTGMIMDVI
jgi:hypothetical protein